VLNIKRLGLADARKLIKGAKRKVKRIGVPMCIAIADESGFRAAPWNRTWNAARRR